MRDVFSCLHSKGSAFISYPPLIKFLYELYKCIHQGGKNWFRACFKATDYDLTVSTYHIKSKLSHKFSILAMLFFFPFRCMFKNETAQFQHQTRPWWRKFNCSLAWGLDQGPIFCNLPRNQNLKPWSVDLASLAICLLLGQCVKMPPIYNNY